MAAIPCQDALFSALLCQALHAFRLVICLFTSRKIAYPTKYNEGQQAGLEVTIAS
jgi:hypothetical protein